VQASGARWFPEIVQQFPEIVQHLPLLAAALPQQAQASQQRVVAMSGAEQPHWIWNTLHRGGKAVVFYPTMHEAECWEHVFRLAGVLTIALLTKTSTPEQLAMIETRLAGAGSFFVVTYGDETCRLDVGKATLIIEVGSVNRSQSRKRFERSPHARRVMIATPRVLDAANRVATDPEGDSDAPARDSVPALLSALTTPPPPPTVSESYRLSRLACLAFLFFIIKEDMFADHTEAVEEAVAYSRVFGFERFPKVPYLIADDMGLKLTAHHQERLHLDVETEDEWQAANRKPTKYTGRGPQPPKN
jgi:hypothetical protein